jgi:predicted kinase
MAKVLMMKGAPSSGKSTHALRLLTIELNGPYRYARVNKDLLREMLFGGKWTQGNEKVVNKVQDAIAEVIIKEGINLIVDNTNLSQSAQDQCKRYADLAGTVLEVEDFTGVPVTECLERDSKRGEKSVGRKVILDMWNRYIRSQEVYPSERHLRSCVICDLDGTLFDTSHRNAYDASNCYDDTIRQPVYDIVHNQLAMGVHVLFFSGRSDKHREETERCLHDKAHISHQDTKAYHATGYQLFMRKEGDTRRDSIVKTEIFNDHVRGKYNVAMVIDDRQQVCLEAWSALGLDDRLIRVGRVLGDEF